MARTYSLVGDDLTAPTKPGLARGLAHSLQGVGSARARPLPPAVIVVAMIAVTCAASALLATVGADARWLAALGRAIVARGRIPLGVPFAAAPSGHWPNTIATAELIFRALEQGFGDRGLMFVQLIAVGVGVGCLIVDGVSDGADPRSALSASSVAAVGALPALVVIRAQLFSLALFPMLVLLLRSEARNPSRRIWLVLPLLSLWSNLHGAALLGLVAVVIYLAFSRFRQTPRIALALIMLAPIAVCLTPAGVHTVAYYEGVLTNAAAKRGQGLWAPLSFGAPLDVLLIVSALTLGICAARRRVAPWELVVLTLLAGLTVKAGRSGIWLLLFLAPLAAPALKARAGWDRLLPAAGTVALVVLAFALARGPLPSGASASLIARAISSSRGTPVLADDILAEQVALAGGRIWIGNPIDAFSNRDQNTYLDWLQGQPQALQSIGGSVNVVLTTRGSAAQLLMRHSADFALVASDRRALLFVRRPVGPAS